MKKGFVFLETIIVLTIVTLSLTILISSYTLITTKAKEKENYDRISEKYLLYTLSNLGTNASYNYKNIAEKGYLKITPETCANDQSINQLNNESINISSPRVFQIKNNRVESSTQDKCVNGNTISNDDSCSFFHIFQPQTFQNYEITIDSSQYSKTDSETDSCEYVFKEVLGLEYLYVIQDIDEILKSKIATQIFDAGTLNYIKTLKKCYDKEYNTTMDENGNMIVVDKGEISCSQPVRYMIGVFYRNGKHYFASIEL